MVATAVPVGHQVVLCGDWQRTGLGQGRDRREAGHKGDSQVTHIKGAHNAYKIARCFGVGVAGASYRAVRHLMTGGTGRYRVRV